MRTRERILILVLLAVGTALVMFGGARGGRTVEGATLRVVSIGEERDRVVSTLTLSGTLKKTIPVKGPLGTTIVEVDGTRARVVSSPCPDKICVKMGWLEQVGDYSACLPNRVLIEMVDK